MELTLCGEEVGPSIDPFFRSMKLSVLEMVVVSQPLMFPICYIVYNQFNDSGAVATVLI